MLNGAAFVFIDTANASIYMEYEQNEKKMMKNIFIKLFL